MGHGLNNQYSPLLKAERMTTHNQNIPSLFVRLIMAVAVDSTVGSQFRNGQ